MNTNNENKSDFKKVVENIFWPVLMSLSGLVFDVVIATNPIRPQFVSIYNYMLMAGGVVAFLGITYAFVWFVFFIGKNNDKGVE